MDVKSCNGLKKTVEEFYEKNNARSGLKPADPCDIHEISCRVLLVGNPNCLRLVTFISEQCIQIQFIANQATDVLITVARSDSARRRSNLKAGHK